MLLGDRVLVMSGRPGRIQAEFVVPTTRPRDMRNRNHPDVQELSWRIWKNIRSRREAQSGTAGYRSNSERMTSHWKQFRWERALPAVILLSLLLIWETGSRIGLIKPLLFPRTDDDRSLAARHGS